MNINTQIKKLEEKDLELISGGKLKPKVKERIEKNSFSTVGYRAGQIVFAGVGAAIGFTFGGSIKFNRIDNYITGQQNGNAQLTGYSITKEFQVNPALGCGAGLIGGLIGMKLWDEIANNIF